MATPSQGFVCKGCGSSEHQQHETRRLYCVECFKRMSVDYQRKYKEKNKELRRHVFCKKCSAEFSTERSGRVTLCPACHAEYMRKYSAENKERHRSYAKAYRERLGDEYRQRCVNRRKDIIASMSPEELQAFRKAECDKSARITAELRKQVFAAYGGYKCACCGETEPLFLSIDHINNDGCEMRRKGEHGRGGTAFYQYLRKNNFPDGFQVLCMNCNVGKHRNGGVCPHKQIKV